MNIPHKIWYCSVQSYWIAVLSGFKNVDILATDFFWPCRLSRIILHPIDHWSLWVEVRDRLLKSSILSKSLNWHFSHRQENWPPTQAPTRKERSRDASDLTCLLQRLLFKWYVQVRWRSVWLPSWHLTALLPRETTKSLVCQRLAPQWRRRTNLTGIVSCSKLKWVLLRLLVCQHLQYPPNRHLL